MDEFFPRNKYRKRAGFLALTVFLGFGLRTGVARELTPRQFDVHFKKKYNFSHDWFTKNIPLWSQELARFKGKEGISYLEIGSAEGMSAIWMLENILTHPTASIVCIDIFPGRLQETFMANLETSGSREKATVIKGPSQAELRKLPLNSFDIIYVDGSHTAPDVLMDTMLSWQLLKPGGIIIFDDYQWNPYLPGELRPQMAVDSFLASFRGFLEVVHHGYQLMVKKI
jgi:predicted O-methyltransferase YrrM